MRRYLLALFFTLALVNLIVVSRVATSTDFDDDDDSFDADERQLVERLIDGQKANQFYKRLFHPFSTKNEEIKRETKEVYEEKCEHVIPTKRNCPDIKTWAAFKNYENGE